MATRVGLSLFSIAARESIFGSMQRPNVLVIVVDGLRAASLGSYGNTTFPTPALDQFAADCMLYDNCFALTSDLDGVYQSLWRSMHPARSGALLDDSSAVGGLNSLAAEFEKQDYDCALITDAPELASVVEGHAFTQATLLSKSTAEKDTAERAEDASQTQLAKFFATVGDLLLAGTSDDDQLSARPKLVWAHTRGMYGAWDAPLDYQNSLRDEDDPLPIDRVVPPDVVLSADSDPDVLFAYACAYAAQIIVLDDCWRNLLEELAEHDLDSWLLMLIGARGFPLGEHGKIGGIDTRLYSEQLHVPWLVRLPKAKLGLSRSGGLTSHLDVLPTLIDTLAVGEPSSIQAYDGRSVLPRAEQKPTERCDALFAVDGSAFALRTSSWCLRESAEDSDDDRIDTLDAKGSELFVRPDDRWEANDVSKLCPEIAEELRNAALRVRQTLSAGGAMPDLLLAETAEPS
jgi:arylsulfatase A-like enzyme